MLGAEPLTAQITALTHDGRGIAQINGKTTFIEGGLPGETVLFTYTKQRGKYDEGRVIEIITPSPDRVEPLCQHFSICGGCALQHLSSTAQVQMKQEMLLNQLQHFGGIEPSELMAPLLAPIWGYRRKARLSVKYVGKKQTVLVGFHEKNGRYIAAINRCEILQSPLDGLITPLKELVHSLKAYQHIPQIEVAIGDNATALVFRHLVPLGDDDIHSLIDFSKQYNLRLYLQPHGPSSTHLVWPENVSDMLSYSLSSYGLELEFHPTDFIQINAAINQQMIAQALGLLEVNSEDRVLDLFCGLGNFSLPLARSCAEVTGIEGDEQLVLRAKNNALKNQINNVDFFCADLNNEFNFARNHFNKILLDPPRTGALTAVQEIAKLNAERIVYVSCNPATLARDAGELIQAGYQLAKVGVMDMFPHTYHVEAMGVFTK